MRMGGLTKNGHDSVVDGSWVADLPKAPSDLNEGLKQSSLTDPAMAAGSVEGLSVRNSQDATTLCLNAPDRLRERFVAHYGALC